MQGSTIYGNIAALVVVQVDPSSPYGSDPGHPGLGTVAAVIHDGAGLFPQAAPRRALAPAGAISAGARIGSGEVIAHAASGIFRPDRRSSKLSVHLQCLVVQGP